MNIQSFILLDKEKVATYLFYTGLLILFLGTMHPWFMWPLDTTYMYISFLFIAPSLILSNSSCRPIYVRRDFFMALMLYAILSVYQAAVNSGNIKGYIAIVARVFVFLALFRADEKRLNGLSDFLAKVMGAMLLVSIVGMLLVFAGFPVPHFETDYQDGTYKYINYYFFLFNITDFRVFPRFSSYFIEPGYLAAMSMFILATQWGHWKKWYNITLLVASFLTFALTAYVLFVAIVFLNLWLEGKKIIMKAVAFIAVAAIFVSASFVYNDGDNWVHDLILVRLEVEDGELSGNDRVTVDFSDKFNDMITSGDAFFGRDVEELGWGNSGARVYIYDFGVIGLVLVLIWYYYALKMGSNHKYIFASAVLSFMIFLSQGNPIWPCYFFSLYIYANQQPRSNRRSITSDKL